MIKNKKILNHNKKTYLLKVNEAITKIKIDSESKKRKFVESIELIMVINRSQINPDSQIRGTISLPHGRGKESKIAYFTKNKEEMQKAMSLGAKAAGLEELINKIDSEKIKFDFCLSTPDAMQSISKIAKKLGPRGLMPSQKDETISTNVEHTIKDFKDKRVKFKVTKNGVIQCIAGTTSQDNNELAENIKHIKSFISSFPTSQSLTLCSTYLKSTMGMPYEILFE